MPSVQLKRSTTAGTVPSDLLPGEPAVNLADHRLYLGGGAPEGYPLSGGAVIPWVRRSGVFRVVGDVTASSLTNFNMIANRIYFYPFCVPVPITLQGFMISVTAAAAGVASVGIYDNVFAAGQDNPGALLRVAAGIDTGTTGEKTGTFDTALTLVPGRLYWPAVTCQATAQLRALAQASVQSSLGRPSSGSNGATYLYGTGANGLLPATAPSGLLATASNSPALWVIEG